MGVALLMAGCSAENGSEEGVGTPIRLGYTVVTAEATRAATNLNEGHLKADDKVMVQVSTHDADSYSPYAFLVVDDAGQMVPASAPIPTYPDNGDHVDIVAYYPSTAETSFTVKADQTSDDNYRASDLMVASISNQERTTSAVDLRFEHQMAKIIVNATAADPSIAINGITLKNIAPTVTFSQTAAVDYSTAATGSIDITMSNNGAALIPQQTVNGQFLVISTSAGNATYSLTKDFTASHAYTLNITVSSAAIGATNTISGWTGDGTATVYADRGVALANAGVGMVICSDGKAYAPDAMLPSSVTKVAVVAYVGLAGSADNSSTTYHGLAIALNDAATQDDGVYCTQVTNYCTTHYSTGLDAPLNNLYGIEDTSTYMTNSSGHTHPLTQVINAYRATVVHPTGTSDWFVPSMGQWYLMIKGLTGLSETLPWANGEGTSYNPNYNSENVSVKIVAAGGTKLSRSSYAITEGSPNAFYKYNDEGCANSNGKNGGLWLRLIIAF